MDKYEIGVVNTDMATKFEGIEVNEESALHDIHKRNKDMAEYLCKDAIFALQNKCCSKDIESNIKCINDSAKQSIQIPPTLFHRTTQKNLINILRDGAINTGDRGVVSFSTEPVREDYRGGACFTSLDFNVIIEISPPKDVCFVPFHYVSDTTINNPYYDLFSIIKTNELKKQQQSCNKIKLETVFYERTGIKHHTAEKEVSGMCLDSHGNQRGNQKQKIKCVSASLDNIVSITPTCDNTKEQIIEELKKNNLGSFIRIVKDKMTK